MNDERDYDSEIRETRSKVESLMKEFERVLSAQLPPDWGFSLLIAQRGENAGFFYTGDLKPAEIIAKLQQFIQQNRQRVQ